MGIDYNQRKGGNLKFDGDKKDTAKNGDDLRIDYRLISVLNEGPDEGE